MESQFLTIFCILTIVGFCILHANCQTEASITSRLFLIESDKSFPYILTYKETETLSFNYSFELGNATNFTDVKNGWVISASLDSDTAASLVGNTEFHIETNQTFGIVAVSLRGKVPGRSTLNFNAQPKAKAETDAAEWRSEDVSFLLFVERPDNPLDKVFNVIVVLLVVVANIGLGAKIELEVVKNELRRPIAPIIGVCSQFIVMPLVAFAISKAIKLDPGVALGFFALGCAPGGSASNMYSYLLKGSVSLSVTMTFISTVAALGMMPLWIFTLGRVVYDGTSLQIPFENIFFSLLGVICPVVIGFVLRLKLPKVAKIFVKAIKVMVILFLIFVFTVGVYASLYIFELMSPPIILASAALPYLGFILGGLVAFVLRQPLTNIITIAVETGIQNTGIPIVLLRLSLEGPDKDTSIVAPVASAMLTPIPMVFAIAYVQIRQCIENRKQKADTAEEGCVYTNGDVAESPGVSGEYLIVRNTEDKTENHTLEEV